MDETAQLVADALQQLNVTTRGPLTQEDLGADLIVDPDGLEVAISVKRWSLVDGEVVRRLIARSGRSSGHGGPVDVVIVLVGDRVTHEARREILGSNWGYLDLRGDLALRSPRLLISGQVQPVYHRPERRDPIGGKVGLEVATAILKRPREGYAVRELARVLDRSPSTVSEALASLRTSELVQKDHTVADSRLFWAVAERWPSERSYLATPWPGSNNAINRPLRLGLEHVETTPGWALTDVVAAAVLGAPVAVRSGQTQDFFVPDAAVLRRARVLLDPATANVETRCSVRIAPVPDICRRRISRDDNPWEWPLAHPVYVALDLALDGGRGHEILEQWNPSGELHRVW